jgi:alkanesulfonate monooxygenase SsuD/methylene tetrahydromethanopterin reductase-like flavin-dependent oxidoreductase (luciferase family)
MKFSLFYEMQISEPTRQTEFELFHNCVKECVLADEVGFHGVWAVEHHGLYEYAHSSAPEVFLSYVAAKTKNIKIGHGVTLLPGKYNHPIRIAERIATLDILSEGRVRWGTGKSGTKVEQGAFEIDPAELEAQWIEALHMIPEMWKDKPFEWKGDYYNIPPTHIVPKPYQRSHPPIFAACSRPELAIKAGEMGLGALNFAIYNDEKLKERVDEYRAATERAKPAGEFVTNYFCCNPSALVLKDDKKAVKYGLAGAQYFLRAMMNYYVVEERKCGPVSAPKKLPCDRQIEAYIKNRNTPGSQLSQVIGDPVSARETIQRFVDAGVDEVIFVMQVGTVPHEMIMESIKTIGEEVIPYFS